MTILFWTVFVAEGENEKDFVWWRVCMLMKNVKSVTYRLGGELDDLVETVSG